MAMELLASLVAGLIGLILTVIAGTASGSVTGRRLLLRLWRRPEAPKSYADRLSGLTASLTTASAEVDAILSELAHVAADREETLGRLESDLAAMERKETEAKERIEALQDVPIAVAEHFARLVAPTERRNARRDYVLFGAGVVVTTVIAVVMQAFASR